VLLRVVVELLLALHRDLAHDADVALDDLAMRQLVFGQDAGRLGKTSSQMLHFWLLGVMCVFMCFSSSPFGLERLGCSRTPTSWALELLPEGSVNGLRLGPEAVHSPGLTPRK